LSCNREKWLFTPAVPPDRMGPLPEVAAPSDLLADVFRWEPMEPSPFVFEMDDGIIRVYSDASHSCEPWPLPGNSYDFFTDLHRWANMCPRICVPHEETRTLAMCTHKNMSGFHCSVILTRALCMCSVEILLTQTCDSPHQKRSHTHIHTEMCMRKSTLPQGMGEERVMT
jgi:hypothetical protein